MFKFVVFSVLIAAAAASGIAEYGLPAPAIAPAFATAYAAPALPVARAIAAPIAHTYAAPALQVARYAPAVAPVELRLSSAVTHQSRVDIDSGLVAHAAPVAPVLRHAAPLIAHAAPVAPVLRHAVPALGYAAPAPLLGHSIGLAAPAPFLGRSFATPYLGGHHLGLGYAAGHLGYAGAGLRGFY